METFLWANDKLELNASATVLSRHPEAFQKKAPHLVNHPSLSFHTGDVRHFPFREGHFSYVIHAAAESAPRLSAEAPWLIFDTIVDGTRRTLEFACQHGAEKFLLLSSGAVYGRQPSELTHVPEDYPGAPDPMNPMSAYGMGKRTAEHLCALYARRYGIQTKIARGFAFVGPHLPLDAHFAIGNFIRDALAGGPICVQGDGTPYRSYLYAADLAIWLWTILFAGQSCRPYNVGSTRAIPIADVANTVATAFEPRPEVRIAHEPRSSECSDRYVPCTKRSVSELKLAESISLVEMILRTAWWTISTGSITAQVGDPGLRRSKPRTP